MARGKKVWLNGKIINTEEAQISIFSHTLHYGTGAFEGIRAYQQANGNGAIFRLKDHIQRLFESTKILGLKIPFQENEVSQACIELCKENQFKECYIRPIVFIGDSPLGVDPGTHPPVEIAILNWEWGKYLGEEEVNQGARLKTSSFIRPHPNSVMTKGKITGQYVTGFLAKREAVSSGFNEALLLDPEGFLTEGTGENLFLVKDQIIKTTPLTSILGGITRHTVITHLRHKGFEVQESRFTRDELWCADEVFLTGTAAEITPIREIDFRSIGILGNTGKLGPITQSIKSDYDQMVRGKIPSHHPDWLSEI